MAQHLVGGARHGVRSAYPPNNPYPDNCDGPTTARGRRPAPLLARPIVGQNQPCTSMVSDYERSEDTPELGKVGPEGTTRSPAFRTDLGDARGFRRQAPLHRRRSGRLRSRQFVAGTDALYARRPLDDV